jgi:lantibiotic transport system ATP-binding protein
MIYRHFIQQILGFVISILVTLIILDEPTNGLDPRGIKDIRNLIKSFPERLGVTVLFSSHLLHEVSQISDKVAIINKGELLVHGEVESLTDKTGHYMLKTNND